MEETRIIKRVGHYSIGQASPEDCKQCHNAKYATVLVDGVCLDCLLSSQLEPPGYKEPALTEEKLRLIQDDIFDCLKAIEWNASEGNIDVLWMNDSPVHESIFERLEQIYLNLKGEKERLKELTNYNAL